MEHVYYIMCIRNRTTSRCFNVNEFMTNKQRTCFLLYGTLWIRAENYNLFFEITIELVMEATNTIQ
jgi:hypothetical protein